MMHYGSVPFDMNTLRRGYPTTDNGFCLTPNVTQGRSRGTVRLRSRDFRDRPRVDPRYFTDPEGYDERIMLTGVKLARTIAEQAPLAAGWAGNSRRDPTRLPTTNCSTTSTSATTPSITRRRRHGWVRSPTRWRCSIRSCGSRE